MQHLLIVSVSLGQLFVFVTVTYKSWNITQIHIFKLKYILTAPKIPENCNFLLMMILLTSLAIKNLKNLFCNIVVKHLMLKKFGLQTYYTGPLGVRLHCCRGTECVGLWGQEVQNECHLKSQVVRFTQQYNVTSQKSKSSQTTLWEH